MIQSEQAAQEWLAKLPEWDADAAARIDRLIFLAAPDWAVVGEWRDQQEADLRQQSPSAMTPVEVARFIQHYERLTRWMLAEMPKRADLTLRLDRQRQVI